MQSAADVPSVSINYTIPRFVAKIPDAPVNYVDSGEFGTRSVVFNYSCVSGLRRDYREASTPRDASKVRTRTVRALIKSERCFITYTKHDSVN